jgi:phage virion morphogenesis protein
MSGASIEIQDQGVQTAFDRLFRLNAGGAALKWIGTEVASQTRARFDTAIDPDGNPWAALNPGYALDKKGVGILRGLAMRGGLQGSITFAVEGGAVRIGSNKIYAAIHQFGGTIVPKHAQRLAFVIGGGLWLMKSVTIPRRAYLGLSAEDRTGVEAMLVSQISRLLSTS